MSHPFSAPSIQTGITQKYSSFIKTHVIFQNLQKYIIFERQNRKLLFPGCWIPTVTLRICPEQIKAVRALSDTVSFQYLMKKLGSIKSFSGRSLKTWNQCSHPAQIHKTLQISLSVNSQHLPICQLKPEVLNSSKILSSRSWDCCWGSETHCTHFRWEYRKVKKCFISNKGQFFFFSSAQRSTWMHHCVWNSPQKSTKRCTGCNAYSIWSGDIQQLEKTQVLLQTLLATHHSHWSYRRPQEKLYILQLYMSGFFLNQLFT